MTDKLVIKSNDKEVAVGDNGKVAFDATHIAGTIISAGTYKALFRNDAGDSEEVDVPEVMVGESTQTLGLVEFTGDVSKLDINKTKVKVAVKYTDPSGKYSFASFAKINWQGMSSINAPKKNYAVKLYSDDTFADKLKLQVHDGWYETHAYVLKGDFVDPTHARNMVGAKLWKQIAQDKTTQDLLGNEPIYQQLAKNGQYGSVDGFPVEVRINGKFMGLYSFNLDNTTSMTGLTDTDTKAIQMNAKGWGNVSMGWDVNAKLDGSSGDFKLETPEDSNAELLKQAQSAVYNWIAYTQFYGIDSFKQQWGSMYDIYNVIDYGLMMNLMNAQDNMCNNVGYISLDGKKFFMIPYDMDGAFDNTFGGQTLNADTGKYDNSRKGWVNGNRLLQHAFLAYPEVAVKRWNDLSKTVFTQENLYKLVDDWATSVGNYGYTLDNTVWPENVVPARKFSSVEQIKENIDEGLAFMNDQSADGFKIVARQYANGFAGGYTASVGDTMPPANLKVTATSDGALIEDGEPYANRENQSFIVVGSKGQLVTQAKGKKAVTITGLTAGTSVNEGDYTVIYREGSKDSSKVKVPAFTVSE